MTLAATGLAAPAGGKQVQIQNKCNYDLTVAQMTNGQAFGDLAPLAQGQSKTYATAHDWSGRFWARVGACSSSDTNCTTAGAAGPASLAEFTFGGWGGNDYYDISFVDGFNLPVEIVPSGGKNSSVAQGKYNCGAPKCATLPTCPDNFKMDGSNGSMFACKSACSATNKDSDCCTGSFNNPKICKANQFATQMKSACPDAYSFAYDDSTSTFTCQADTYTVVFCPAK
ncbi:Osmotin, thaumatin-like protein [Hesseltinella vesiculosa]|uniref:Osmotin, thaumatin-like protein n=1 Tax=Hesseltinella vesiculosa TaxID=101127 RepID=A0A1X2GWJ6_9FUNG|nr:Osmotin, thaumatin-like protein [Hesseltinella vesiculosa]